VLTDVEPDESWIGAYGKVRVLLALSTSCIGGKSNGGKSNGLSAVFSSIGGESDGSSVALKLSRNSTLSIKP
jgi:hypothetical protein